MGKGYTEDVHDDMKIIWSNDLGENGKEGRCQEKILEAYLRPVWTIQMICVYERMFVFYFLPDDIVFSGGLYGRQEPERNCSCTNVLVEFSE